MYRNNAVAVVIPAHNEELHVRGVLETIPSFVDMVVVVDDASTDGTAEEVNRADRPNVELVQHRTNRGLGAAVVTGYRLALERGVDVVAVLDGDGQMDSHQLPRLLDPIVDGETDFAKGNRFFSRRSFEEMPAYRVFGNLVLTFLTKVATGYWHMFDSENGYTAISARMLRALRLESLETGYQFPNRLLIELSSAGARIRDVPMLARYGEETSGIRPLRDGLAIVRALFAGFWMRAGREYILRPSLPGALLALSIVGLLAGAGGLLGILPGVGGPAFVGAALTLGAAGLALFFALDASRKRGRARPAGEEPREVVTLDLESGRRELPQDEPQLARREKT